MLRFDVRLPARLTLYFAIYFQDFSDRTAAEFVGRFRSRCKYMKSVFWILKYVAKESPIIIVRSDFVILVSGLRFKASIFCL